MYVSLLKGAQVARLQRTLSWMAKRHGIAVLVTNAGVPAAVPEVSTERFTTSQTFGAAANVWRWGVSLLLGYESPTNIISQMLFRARLTVSLLNAFIVRGYFLDDFLCCPLSSSLGYSWAHIADVRMALRLKTAVLGVEVDHKMKRHVCEDWIHESSNVSSHAEKGMDSFGCHISLIKCPPRACCISTRGNHAEWCPWLHSSAKQNPRG